MAVLQRAAKVHRQQLADGLHDRLLRRHAWHAWQIALLRRQYVQRQLTQAAQHRHEKASLKCLRSWSQAVEAAQQLKKRYNQLTGADHDVTIYDTGFTVLLCSCSISLVREQKPARTCLAA